MAQKFWGCAYAKTESPFNRVLAEIHELNGEAAEYIPRLPREKKKIEGAGVEIIEIDMSKIE